MFRRDFLPINYRQQINCRFAPISPSGDGEARSNRRRRRSNHKRCHRKAQVINPQIQIVEPSFRGPRLMRSKIGLFCCACLAGAAPAAVCRYRCCHRVALACAILTRLSSGSDTVVERLRAPD